MPKKIATVLPVPEGKTKKRRVDKAQPVSTSIILKKCSKPKMGIKNDSSSSDNDDSENSVDSPVEDINNPSADTNVDEQEGEDEVERVVEDDINNNKTLITFAELGLSPWLCASSESVGIVHPTAIQRLAIPRILAGEDVIGSAQTGSGKTAAFALPILEKLYEDPYGVFAVVITPTRELAMQISDQFRAFGAGNGLRQATVIGGVELLGQNRQLNDRPHIITATPGRLAAQLTSGSLSSNVLANAKFLVLDEADRLLEDAFTEPLAQIMALMPPSNRRQTLLFSATMTSNIDKLSRISLNKPYRIDVTPKYAPLEQLRQQYVFIPATVKDAYLSHIVSEMKKDGSVIIFVATCRFCELIFLALRELGESVVRLSGHLSQAERTGALHRFRAGEARILVATDVASRGLDIPTVQTVINYDIPNNAKDYTHRVGRTARAGRGGIAISMVTQYDIELIQHIEDKIGQKLELFQVNEDSVLRGLSSVTSAVRTAKVQLLEREKRFSESSSTGGASKVRENKIFKQPKPKKKMHQNK